MKGFPINVEESERSRRFRSTIAAFIEGRREAKLKGKENDADTGSKYEYEAWLADAARRVSQIQAVTHVLKATHPDARGSSLHIAPGGMHKHTEVGSHLLGEDFAEDVVGNAAALDVFKLLKLDVEGRRLLDWMMEGDPDLGRALNSSAEVASAWMAAFGALVRTEMQPASHALGKQVYWLTGDEPTDDSQYHLLQPMFSSSLAHAVHAEISAARFGDDNKLARQAFRDKTAFNGSYRDYRGLVARKLGGTKPQNISQLNSERGGVNYLLASLPPKWERQPSRAPLKLDSALERFGYFEDIRTQLRALIDLLKKYADTPSNLSIRTQREHIEQDLGASLAAFGLDQKMRLVPGWTRDPDCLLPLCEQLWLDPERTELPVRIDAEHPEWEQQDRAFNAAYTWGGWPDEVAGRFANWVNARLRDSGLVDVGDAEYRHWARHAVIEVAWPIPLQRRAGGTA